MAAIIMYGYDGCGTCRKAAKWLDDHGVAVESRPIRERPPSVRELRQALGAVDGQLRKLFNTSGRDYRSEGIKDRLPGLSETETIALLRSNGNLIKRPIVIAGDQALVGFNETQWRDVLG